ncbi:MAG: hypothetical protein HGA49_01870 [Eubacteriaceae bacterium]|nr:hypothetical protein [Eubacteriaceae bacterium]
MISSRELVIQTIKRQATFKVPKGELVLDDEVIQKALTCKTIGFEERSEFAHSLGLDIISLSPKYLHDQGEVSIELESMNVEAWTKKTSLFSFVLLDGAFELGMRVFGFEEFLSMIMEDPEDTLEFVERVERLNMETASKLADLGVNGIIIADDVAYQDGLIIRHQLFRELFLPSLERQVRAVSQKNMIPFFHSDGNYLSIMEDVIDAGFKGIHCIDKNCGVSLEELAPYSKKICLWGHLDIEDLKASREEAGLNQLVGQMKETTDFKGFILGTNSGLFTGMDLHGLRNIYQTIDDKSIERQ